LTWILQPLQFTTLIPLSLLISYKASFLIVGLKISSFPTFALTFPNKIFVWYFGNSLNTCYSSSELSFVSSLLSSFGAYTFRTIISHQ